MATKLTCECLKKVGDDEPIFILRAQDVLAPRAVRHWADLLAAHRGIDHPKVLEAYKTAETMFKWSGKKKFPD